MTGFSTALTTAPSPTAAAAELAAQLEEGLGGPDRLAGGVVLATAAAGKEAAEAGWLLGRRWPDAGLLGSSFEGILAGGRVWRDRPALAAFAWNESPWEPRGFCFDPRERDLHRIAHEILDAAGRSQLGPADVVLLFPDAVDSPGLERILAELGALLGRPSIAGAAAAGIDGHPAQGWIGDQDRPGSMLGLVVPAEETGGGLRVRSAGASRAASPWLEITASRPRWLDGLEGEPPLDWVRRQLGIEAEDPVEPFLDRLLIRVCRRVVWEAEREQRSGVRVYDEGYVVGVDDRRGSISLSAAFERGDRIALALPDPERARAALRSAIDSLPITPLLLQLACRTRDETLHGDADLESAWVAHHAGGRPVLGTVSPFQFGTDTPRGCRMLVHATVLTALGPCLTPSESPFGQLPLGGD
jgi:small ligand-binding sensory domain FIST